MCVIWCVVDVLCCTASILNLLIISLDRWLAISYPMRYHSFATRKRAIIAIILVWFLSVLICLPPVFGWRKEPTDENKCELTDEIGYVIYSALGSFWIPSIILIIVYSRIYVVAARQTKQIAKQQAQLGEIKEEETPSVSSSPAIKVKDALPLRKLKKFAKEKRAAKTLAVVVGTFLVCWTPFFTVYILHNFVSVPKTLFKIVFWLGYCNSALNPMIYPFFSRDFRTAMKKMLSKIFCRWEKSIDNYRRSSGATTTRLKDASRTTTMEFYADETSRVELRQKKESRSLLDKK
ncbi:DgyrCDS883 [Dimorphilus gyrociliatus]|nr:DgyrCDS883 [Dimorphilus gyrociliatus]